MRGRVVRNFLWVGSLCCSVVMVTACKSLIRQPLNEIYAVSDAQLTLGLVPIQKGDGMHAYRMLVCKKAGAYPPQLLEDDGHCRVALLDEDSTEVVFWPNDFKRDFSTKYKGYIKHAALATIAVVPLALVGRKAGRWKLLKLEKKDIGGSLTLKDFAKGKFSSKLINSGIGSSGLTFYRQAWRFRANEIFTKIAQSSDVDEIQTEIKAFRNLTNMFESAAQLKALGDSKHFFEQIRTMSTKKVEARYDLLKEEIIDYNGSIKLDEEGSFTKNFFEHKKHYQELITVATTKGKSLDEMKDLTEELRKAAVVYDEGLSLYEDLSAKLTILTERNNSDHYRLINSVNDSFANKKAELLANENDVMRLSVELVNTASNTRRNTSMYALGGGGLGIGILSAIDKSIWGYADRQLNQHWNQIFVDNDDFAEAQPVLDIRVLLKALADEFGFAVNERALQLADDI